jgi:hypothetical protein
VPTKSVRPRWGYSGPGFKYRPVFSDDDVRELAGLLGKDAEAERLAELLKDAAETCQRLQYFDQTEVSPAEIKAALRALHQMTRQLSEHLHMIDSATKSLVARSYENHRLESDPVEEGRAPSPRAMLTEDIRRVDRLNSVFRLSLDRHCVPRGPGTIGMLRYFAREFASVHEQISGEHYKAPRSIKRRYLARDEFLARTIRRFAPEATGQQLQTAFRYAADYLRRERTRAKEDPSDNG